MFNLVKVDFPDAPSTQQPSFVHSVRLIQQRNSHEMVEIMFRDWDIPYEVIAPNSLVTMTLYGGLKRKDFYGYVKYVQPEKTPGKNFVKAVFIGGSFPMQNKKKKIYKNVTADQIVRQIAKDHQFYCYTEPHPRVFQQVSQDGISDWNLMTRLAHQCGYELRTTNTELYFVPILWDYEKYRAEAPIFAMGSLGNIDGTSIYEFDLTAGESISYGDATKAAVSIGGFDPKSSNKVIITEQKGSQKTRKRQTQEIFDDFDTQTVAPGLDIAKFESKAAEARNNSFPYRARVVVTGDPSIRVNMPIYLEGLGENYSGYWTVLSVEHQIEEEELNRHRFITVLEVGADSLGTALTWKDNQLITSPNYRPKRTIVSGVRQTIFIPKTIKSITSVRVTPQTEQLFGDVKNRSRSTGARTIKAPRWISSTPSTIGIPAPKKTSPVIKKRKFKKDKVR